MSDTYTSLSDLVKINDKNAVDLGVTDLFNDAPFLRVVAAGESSNGSTHKWVRETSAPATGFRAPNVGLENKASGDTLDSIDLKILDASFAVDKALADAYRGGSDAYVAREAGRHLRSALFEGEKQCINGTGNNADGFLGFADEKAYLSPTCLNGGGSTALTSVYLVRTNDAGTDVQVVMDNSGSIEIGESVVQRITISSLHLPAYYTPVEGWMGLQYGSTYSVVRIANLDASTNGLTDDVIYQALAVFPASRMPNYILMGRRSAEQLRASRTATNATGAPAPKVTEVEGVSVIVTDAIGIAEDVVSNS